MTEGGKEAAGTSESVIPSSEVQSSEQKVRELDRELQRQAPVRTLIRKFLSLRPVRRVLRGLDMVGAVLIRTRLGAHVVYTLIPGARPLLCSNCLNDTGLRLDAEESGIVNALACSNCGSRTGKRLTKYLIDYLIYRFFVRGSLRRHKYGGSPWLQFNKHHFRNSTYCPPEWLQHDLDLLSESGGVGIFHYGPRYWMFGEVEPLQDLQDAGKRSAVVARIVSEYPPKIWSENETLFRVRVNPDRPDHESEYDSPPDPMLGQGRLDSPSFPVLYCSQDIEGCIHECRVTVEDDVYLATLIPTRPLRLLDLTVRLDEPSSITEFESLDMAVHMLFFAAAHSYEISRAIACAAGGAGFDGLLYPSYFSQVRSGRMPFETTLGMSWRRLPGGSEYAKGSAFPNIALFGRPIAGATVRLGCINRVMLSRVKYNLSYGPVIQS
jgi:hypothetical protein